MLIRLPCVSGAGLSNEAVSNFQICLWPLEWAAIHLLANFTYSCRWCSQRYLCLNLFVVFNKRLYINQVTNEPIRSYVWFWKIHVFKPCRKETNCPLYFRCRWWVPYTKHLPGWVVDVEVIRAQCFISRVVGDRNAQKKVWGQRSSAGPRKQRRAEERPERDQVSSAAAHPKVMAVLCGPHWSSVTIYQVILSAKRVHKQTRNTTWGRLALSIPWSIAVRLK